MFKLIIPITILLILLFQAHAYTENISTNEAEKLKSFLKEKLGENLPPDAKIEVKGYEKTPLIGFKQGSFTVETPKGSGEVPYLISNDGKYLIFGEPVDTFTFKNSPLGVKEGKIKIGAGPEIPVLMSKDGRYLVLGGELIEFKLTPTNK